VSKGQLPKQRINNLFHRLLWWSIWPRAGDDSHDRCAYADDSTPFNTLIPIGNPTARLAPSADQVLAEEWVLVTATGLAPEMDRGWTGRGGGTRWWTVPGGGSGRVAPQLVLYRSNPIISDDADKAHIQGTVVLDAIIQKDGSVESNQGVTEPDM